MKDLEKIQLEQFCHKSKIKSLKIFGSVARGEPKEDSDLDLIVEFEPEAKVSLLDLVRMERELSQIMGRRAELVTEDALSPYIRDQVLSEAKLLYESR